MPKYNVAIVGATGLVGGLFIELLEQRNFPITEIKLLASADSAGKQIKFQNQWRTVQVLNEKSFKNIDFAFFSAGATVSQQYAPIAAASGSTVIDNSSAFRMEADVPLVVPEVNNHVLNTHNKIIANPNCSTIQMVVVLKPLHQAFSLRRVIVSTYQAVSGTGKDAVSELSEQSLSILQNLEVTKRVYPHQIGFNLVPHIDKFMPDGYTKEEIKMINETRKIMNLNNLRITSTCVRVPVFTGHSISLNAEFDKRLDMEVARSLLEESPGVVVTDDPVNSVYPTPSELVGRDEVFVGRMRRDESVDNGLNLWVVADNLRKGAALNAIQIAELLI
jgi:aspartate-semialdehyde dehydrogenase